MKKIISTLFLVTLTSCLPTYNIPTYQVKDFNNVELNVEKKAEIGEKLIEKGTKVINDAILIESIPQSKAYNNLTVKTGDVLPMVLVYKGYKLYSNNPDTVHLDNGVAVSIKYGYAYPYTFSNIGTFQIIMAKEKIKYTETSSEKNCEKCFKQQFIFNGKVNNSLKFTYREFVNDMARPAFNQDLQYDLSESNIIGFRGLRIEVLKANNISIEYKVLSSFSN